MLTVEFPFHSSVRWSLEDRSNAGLKGHCGGLVCVSVYVPRTQLMNGVRLVGVVLKTGFECDSAPLSIGSGAQRRIRTHSPKRWPNSADVVRLPSFNPEIVDTDKSGQIDFFEFTKISNIPSASDIRWSDADDVGETILAVSCSRGVRMVSVPSR